MDKKEHAFKQALNGKKSWAGLFQSAVAFTPLIELIYGKHGYKMGAVANLTPGTNAVFRVGKTVAKIFAPVESGFSTGEDYLIEFAAMRHANSLDIATPKLLFTGSVEDRYVFKYIIMEYIRGQEAETVLRGYTSKQKESFALKLKGITDKLNIPVNIADIPAFTKEMTLAYEAWGHYPESLCVERKNLIENTTFPPSVYIHGDLTGENIIIGDDGGIYIIDYADSRIAPHYYDWPPIIFAVFGCDPVMMEAYFGGLSDKFYDDLTHAVAIHQFGAQIVQELCEKTGVPMESIRGMDALRQLLISKVEGGCAKVR